MLANNLHFFIRNNYLKPFDYTTEHELGVGNQMGLNIEIPKSIKMHESNKSNLEILAALLHVSQLQFGEREREMGLISWGSLTVLIDLGIGQRRGHGRDKRAKKKREKKKRNRVALSVFSDK